jgi:hypothetical protein
LLKRISRQRRPYSQHNLGLARAIYDLILSSPIENFQFAKAPKSVPTKVTRINSVPVENHYLHVTLLSQKPTDYSHKLS